MNGLGLVPSVSAVARLTRFPVEVAGGLVLRFGGDATNPKVPRASSRTEMDRIAKAQLTNVMQELNKALTLAQRDNSRVSAEAVYSAAILLSGLPQFKQFGLDANSTGRRLLANGEIREKLLKRLAKGGQRTEVTEQTVLFTAKTLYQVAKQYADEFNSPQQAMTYLTVSEQLLGLIQGASVLEKEKVFLTELTVLKQQLAQNQTQTVAVQTPLLQRNVIQH